MSELRLDGDRTTSAPPIAEYLQARAGEDSLRRAVARAVIAIAEAAGPVASSRQNITSSTCPARMALYREARSRSAPP